MYTNNPCSAANGEAPLTPAQLLPPRDWVRQNQQMDQALALFNNFAAQLTNRSPGGTGGRPSDGKSGYFTVPFNPQGGATFSGAGSAMPALAAAIQANGGTLPVGVGLNAGPGNSQTQPGTVLANPAPPPYVPATTKRAPNVAAHMNAPVEPGGNVIDITPLRTEASFAQCDPIDFMPSGNVYDFQSCGLYYTGGQNAKNPPAVLQTNITPAPAAAPPPPKQIAAAKCVGDVCQDLLSGCLQQAQVPITQVAACSAQGKVGSPGVFAGPGLSGCCGQQMPSGKNLLLLGLALLAGVAILSDGASE